MTRIMSKTRGVRSRFIPSKLSSVLKLAVGISLFATQLGSFAHAQEAGVVTELEEIIVTANRREQSIQDVSGVVQTLSAEQIREDGLTEFRQLQQAIPGLSIGIQDGNTEIFIRGVGSSNNTELGDPSAAPHLNGVYIPRPRGLGGFFYDLERVEVNKGPQGTLYGRNGLGGTLNILTKRPDFDSVNGYGQFGVASRDGYDAEAAVNVPLNENSAVRIAGFIKERDFGFNNVDGVEGLDPTGLQEDSGARISYLIEPNDTSSLLLVADYGRETGTGYPGANINEAQIETGLRAEDLPLRDVRFRGRQGDVENEIFGIQAIYNKDFNGFELEVSGSFRSVDYEQISAGNDGIAFAGQDPLQTDNFSGQLWNTTSESIIGEVRLTSNGGGPLQWTVGAFGFSEDQEVLLYQVADRGFCCFSGLEFNFPDVNGESFALYGDVTYALNERTRLIAGLRFTDEHKDRAGIGGGFSLVNGADGFSCCLGTRLGTEGFTPSGFDGRPNFDVTGITTNQQRAQFLLEGVAIPGLRDDLVTQLIDVANGTSPNGNGRCVARPDNDNGFIVCPENGFFSFQNIGIPAQQIGEVDNDFTDFRIGFEHDLSDRHLVYAKVSTGTKAAGFNDTFDGLAETFDSESIVAYEIGSRLTYEAFGRPAVFNATAFYYDYSDQVFQDLQCINFDIAQNECNGFSLLNRNIGESELVGVELESKLNFANNLSLDVNAVILDSEIKSGVVADSREQDFGNGGITPLIDLAGNRLPRQSDLEIVARLQQSFDLGQGVFDWQILAKYRSEFFLTQFNERNLNSLDGSVRTALEIGQATEQEAFTTINVGLGYTLNEGRLRFEAYGQNITDEVASLSQIGGSGVDVRFLNDARTYGVRAIARF